jgi:hypothetical protein
MPPARHDRGRPRGTERPVKSPDQKLTASVRHQMVDGPRPAVDWVRLLPAEWTTSRERLLLVFLALDAFAQTPPFTCSPSIAEIVEWYGERHRRRTYEVIRSLSSPAASGRPALLEVTPGRGRRRSTYRLRTEVGPRLWSGIADHYDDAANSPEYRTTTSDERDASGPRSSPGNGPGNGPDSRTTPFTSLPSMAGQVHKPQVGDHNDDAVPDTIPAREQSIADARSALRGHPETPPIAEDPDDIPADTWTDSDPDLPLSELEEMLGDQETEDAYQ